MSHSPGHADDVGHTGTGAMPTGTIVLVALVVYVPMAAIGIGWVAWRSGWDVVSARFFGVGPVAAVTELVIGALVGLAVVLVCHLARLTSDSARRMESSFARTIGPISAGTALFLAATSAVGEEFLFRGAIQPEIGWIVTSIIFGVLHAPFERSLWLWPIFATATGFLLGWLHDRHDCVLAPTAAHFTVNAIHLELIRRRAVTVHSVSYSPVWSSATTTHRHHQGTDEDERTAEESEPMRKDPEDDRL